MIRKVLGWLTVGVSLVLAGDFQRPPEDCKIMMRWWWFGPAVTKAGLEREMRLMKEGGIGGFEVQPVYPLALDDHATGIRNLPYLSDEFLDMLRFTAKTSKQLGLRMDLTLGSGWPYGGPQIPVSQASGRLRVERVQVAAGSRRAPVPDITGGESLLAAFLAGDSPREVSDIKDGVLRLPAGLEGPHTVLFFISSRTGMMVKRPAVGAEGFVMDHYDRAATDTYLNQVGDRLMKAFGSERPYAVFCDSLEVYGADWTPDFLEQFQKRRGYDLKPLLPALAQDMGEKTAAVRQDWGKTLTELAEERFLAPIREWSHRNKTLFRVQSYGLPPVALSSYRFVDLFEGEGAQWKSLSATRWASSASHLYGKTVTSSETWTWLHSPSFRATPLDMKYEADLHFLSGINQLIGHGWPYTAEGVAYPGWRFYASAVFDEKNPWWIVMPDLALYMQRMSYLLRQGRPANDVAIYLSNGDGWAHLSPGRVNLRETQAGLIGPDVVPRVLEAGYGLDFIDDPAIEQLGRVEKGALAVGDNRYRVVILPNVERIPAGVLQKLSEFAKAGGTLIATRRIPAQAPVRSFVAESGLPEALARALAPDVTLSPAAPEVGFVHRSADAGEIYFLANTGNTPRSVKATFRVTGLDPQWWDAFTGRVEAAAVVERSEAGVTVDLDLEPYGSRVLVFSKQPAAAPAAGRFEPAGPAIDLSSGWTVAFGDQTVKMDKLRSWTEDEDTRYYSGVAAYEKDVTVPEEALAPGLGLRLDFGEAKAASGVSPRERLQALLEAPVREAAVVYVNGQKAGSVWRPPYWLDVTGLLKPGANHIKIVAANLAINYLAGHSKPDYRLLNLRYGERFTPQNMDNLQPLPAGLLGPIRLIGVKKR